MDTYTQDLQARNARLEREKSDLRTQLHTAMRNADAADAVADTMAGERDNALELATHTEGQLRELLVTIADVERGIRSHDELLALAARLELEGPWNG